MTSNKVIKMEFLCIHFSLIYIQLILNRVPTILSQRPRYMAEFGYGLRLSQSSGKIRKKCGKRKTRPTPLPRQVEIEVLNFSLVFFFLFLYYNFLKARAPNDGLKVFFGKLSREVEHLSGL